MTGRASVYIVTKTEEDAPEKAENASTPSKAKAAKQAQEEASQDVETDDKEVQRLDRSTFGKFIMYYGQWGLDNTESHTDPHGQVNVWQIHHVLWPVRPR